MNRIRKVLLASSISVALAAGGATAAGAQGPGDAKGSATATTGTESPTPRGHLVSVKHLRTLSAEQVAAELKSDEVGAWDTGTVRYGVDTYRVVYRTVDPAGRPTIASGLLALPRGGDQRLRTVSFTHGTELYKKDVASVSGEVWSQAPALTYASAGFATVLPDYLGLGHGPGPHPWMDVPSETTAALDMLRAARTFAPTAGRQLRHDVLVTGFSQGASVPCHPIESFDSEPSRFGFFDSEPSREG